MSGTDRDSNTEEFDNVSYSRRRFGPGSVRRDSGIYRHGKPEEDDTVRYDRQSHTEGVSGSRYGTGRGGSAGAEGAPLRGRAAARGARSAGSSSIGSGAGGRAGRSPRGGSAGRTPEGRGRGSRGTGDGNGRRRGGAAIRWILLLLLLSLLAAAGFRVYQDRYGYSSETADLNAVFSLSGDRDVAVIFQDALYDTHALLLDGTFYLPADMVYSLLNKRFYYGKNDGTVYYALPEELVQARVDTKEWSSETAGTVTESYAPAHLEGDVLYLAVDFVHKFTNFTAETFTSPNRLWLRTSEEEKTAATLTRDTKLRTSGGVKSAIIAQEASGSTVYILDRMTDWSRVLTADGYIGYLENRFFSDERQVTLSVPSEYQEPEYRTAQLEGRVSMGWHNVISAEGNTTFASVTANVPSLNVVAPTWFPLLDNNGNINSYATRDYVDAAHAKGFKVWPVVDNFNTQGVDHNTFLTSFASRQTMISQLMSAAATYGFDGINVDFEMIESNYGRDYIEFIRELSIACRKQGLTLSVDNYVTYNFNDYYSMDEQAVFADYVIVMGYDEHYAGSAEAGSVASLSYVEYGLKRALQEVPASKLMNAVPFYTRLWKTDASGLTSTALDMTKAQEFVSSHGAQTAWDDKAGQNYMDFTEDGVHYQMWLEDAQSIEAKLGVMAANGVAGVAAWRLGYETADVWDVISRYVAQ